MAAAAPEPEVPMKLGTHGAIQPGPPDGSCEQPGPLGPSQQVSGQVRAGSGGQSWGRARRSGGHASAVPPPLMGLQNPLYCLWGGGSAGGSWSCRFVPWHAGEVPTNPTAFDVGCSREGGQSMAPNPSVASVVLGARRDCLTVVCLLSLESTDFAGEVHSTWVATQCCRSRVWQRPSLFPLPSSLSWTSVSNVKVCLASPMAPQGSTGGLQSVLRAVTGAGQPSAMGGGEGSITLLGDPVVWACPSSLHYPSPGTVPITMPDAFSRTACLCYTGTGANMGLSTKERG